MLGAKIGALRREASGDGAGAWARNALSAAPGREPEAGPMPGVCRAPGRRADGLSRSCVLGGG
jgi:hypothetical protein